MDAWRRLKAYFQILPPQNQHDDTRTWLKQFQSYHDEEHVNFKNNFKYLKYWSLLLKEVIDDHRRQRTQTFFYR